VPEPHIEPVDDPRDERLTPFRELKEARLAREQGLLIAESEVVVRKLLRSPLVTRAVLLTPARLATLAPSLGPGYPVYVAPQEVLDAVAGFHVHRGCLAAAERPTGGLPPGVRRVVVLEDLVDVDNVGSLVRNAAAFGADAVLLSPGCADAFYRKAVRTSAGHVFTLPVVRASAWPEDLEALGRELALVGTVVDANAPRIDELPPLERVALVLGTEGTGLSRRARELCRHLVTIPMAPGADSLNVAVAGAVALYALGPGRPAPAGAAKLARRVGRVLRRLFSTSG
jgi:tRNA G18 (ribose-2'-O)-methylase SpoU